MFTKYTQVQYDEESWPKTQIGGLSPFLNDIHTQIYELKLAGKTGPSASLGDLPRTWKRVWIDETSADEWKTFTYAKAAEYGLTITDYVIGDI